MLCGCKRFQSCERENGCMVAGGTKRLKRAFLGVLRRGRKLKLNVSAYIGLGRVVRS